MSRKKARRATPEEILMFEKSMKAGMAQDGGKAHSHEDASPCGFSWMDDEVLSGLSRQALLEVAIQYRDIIMGMFENLESIRSAFTTVLERNNILVTDLFGRKSEKLKVLLNGSKPSGSNTQEEDDASRTAITAQTSVTNSESTGSDGQEPQNPEENATEPGTSRDPEDKNGNGKEAGKDNGSKGRSWKPVRSAGCLDKQCRDLPVIERRIELTDKELEGLFGKDNYHRMESNDREIIEYEYIPRTVYVRKTILCAYEADDKTADCVKKEMAAAKNPVVRLRRCSRVTSSVWAFIMYQRYILRLPWHRVSSDLSRSGLALTTQMMEENARFFYGILTAVIQRMWFWLFASGFIQVDETPVLMYDQERKELRRCWFWVFTVSELHGTDKPVTIFAYAKGKGTDVLRKYLVEDHQYSGYATTDGHQPYHIIEEETGGTIRNTGCLNHFRTRLARVMKAIPGLKEMTQEQLAQIPAFNALSSLQVAFKNEKEAAGMSAEDRAVYRKETVFPELEKAFGALSGLDADDYGQGSLMYNALTYRDNQEEYLKRFMEDGRIPLTNSNSERHIAFFALLRNVSHLFGSDEMGAAGAGWESLSQTAAAFTDHVDIYFQFLLDEAVPFIMQEDREKGVKHTAASNLAELEKNSLDYFGDERIDRFMPWSEEFKAYEKRILQERQETAKVLSKAHEGSL